MNDADLRKGRWLAWLEKQGESQDKGEISDGYHTFNELYYYRMLYNAAFFNLLPKEWVHKSKRHHDGEECFGGGWFIVMANLPTGQISNHYELKYWELFHIPKKDVADEWDGHTPKEAAERLHKYLLEKQGEKISVVDFKAEDWYVSKVDGKIYNAKFDENPSCVQIDKQDEQKSIDKVVPKFKVGDWICNRGHSYLIADIDLEQRRYLFEIGGYTHEQLNWEYIENADSKYHLWSIADARDGDVIVYEICGTIILFKGIEDNNIQFYCDYDFSEIDVPGDRFAINNSGQHYGGINDSEDFHPATKEQRDVLMKAMADAGYIHLTLKVRN